MIYVALAVRCALLVADCPDSTVQQGVAGPAAGAAAVSPQATFVARVDPDKRGVLHAFCDSYAASAAMLCDSSMTFETFPARALMTKFLPVFRTSDRHRRYWSIFQDCDFLELL